MDQWVCTWESPSDTQLAPPPPLSCKWLTCSHLLEQPSRLLDINWWTVDYGPSPLLPQELPKAAHQDQHQSRIPEPLSSSQSGDHMTHCDIIHHMHTTQNDITHPPHVLRTEFFWCHKPVPHQIAQVEGGWRSNQAPHTVDLQ